MHKNNKPLVSIITPVYNSLPFLEETFNCVKAQTYTNWEWCITDDCSNDGSWEKLCVFAKEDKRIRPFRLSENSGSGVARNNSIKFARGKFIAFLDSDDIWDAKKLERHIFFMQEKKAVFSHTSYGYIDENGAKIKSTFRVSKKPVTYQKLLKRTEISCLTAVYDAEKIGKYYMSLHRRKQDYALWLAILKTGVHSIPLDEELAYYRQHNSSATSNKFSLIGKHVQFLMQTQEMNLAKALYYTTFWLVNGTIRYYLK
jgi:teichuronic acid biosynthesis glycosyltransferase TuaG